MERNLERSVRGYIGSVKKSLVCNGVQKKRVAAEIEDDIYAYAEENSVKSIDEIVTHFGAPETVAESFIDPGQNWRDKTKNKPQESFYCFCLHYCNAAWCFPDYDLC